MAVELEFYTGEVVKEYNTAVEQAMKEAVLIVEADAKRNAPVNFGRLRADITHQITKIAGAVIEGKVGNTPKITYARFQELGTSKMDPQPYLRPALRNNFEQIVSIIQEAIE